MANTSKRRPRRRFDDDFKAQAVRLVLDKSQSVGSVARDLDLTETALREWVGRSLRPESGLAGLPSSEVRWKGCFEVLENGPLGSHLITARAKFEE